ncbi:hypothetical protein MRB53_001311 [Persea americana]|uniref:Uncharacterized protein n=1 Tax=Persea americana TaxID=3435 RepID=A0ACC2MS12_PERAE|nr:hypothetical protein MRB53_001311 [Persea americana]
MVTSGGTSPAFAIGWGRVMRDGVQCRRPRRLQRHHLLLGGQSDVLIADYGIHFPSIPFVSSVSVRFIFIRFSFFVLKFEAS